MMFRRSILTALATTCFAALALPAGAQTAVSLVPHRAVYNLELAEASERSGINNMFGRMVYEFTGSACEGYRVNFRFVTQVDAGGEKKSTDQQSSTFENVNTGTFDFQSKVYNDSGLEKEVTGSAQKESDAIAITLDLPQKKELSVTNARFPTQHTLDVINLARKGVRFYEAKIYDGLDNGDKALFTSTVVGSPVSDMGADADTAGVGILKTEKPWPVTIAYFNDENASDGLPNYRMSFKLYPNGVSRDLRMDYGDYVLKGSLVKLDFLPESSNCKSN